MKILIVPEIAARESSFVRHGEIQVVGYKEHLEDISRVLDAKDKLLAYDEAKERVLFESTYDHPRKKDSEGQYQYAIDRAAWLGWSACAKSRARSAE